MKKTLFIFLICMMAMTATTYAYVIVQPSYSGKVGESIDLSINTDETLTYSSLDKSIATVNSNGIVKCLKEGKATIIVRGHGRKYTVVKVEKSDSTLTVDTSISIEKGEKKNLNASSNLPITYASARSRIAVVDTNGNVTGVSAGNTTITVSTNRCKKTVNVTVTDSNNSTSSSSYVKKVGDKFNLNITGDEYSSSDPEVVSVDSKGNVTCEEPGSVFILIKQGQVKKKIYITVEKNSNPITINSSFSKYVGDTFYLGIKANGLISYTSSNSDIASISNAGLVTCKKAGTTVITITAAENSYYKESSAKTTITVSEKAKEETPSASKVTSYKSCCGKIVEACGPDKAGKPGDQSGNEIKKSQFSYASGSSARGWVFVLRSKDPAKAELIAQTATDIANNNNIGYDKHYDKDLTKCRATSMYIKLKAANWDASKITSKCETCCCPLAMASVCAAYRTQLVGPNTRSMNLKSAYGNSKNWKNNFTMYTGSTCKKVSNLKRGDILCTGDHTAVCL